MGSAEAATTTDQLASDLVDVTALPLSTLLSMDESVLANSIRRLVMEIRDGDEIVSGHSNAVR
jgi:FXSXX-COOH protein